MKIVILRKGDTVKRTDDPASYKEQKYDERGREVERLQEKLTEKNAILTALLRLEPKLSRYKDYTGPFGILDWDIEGMQTALRLRDEQKVAKKYSKRVVSETEKGKKP